MFFYRNRLPHQAQPLLLGVFLTAAMLISVSQLHVGLGLWLLFIFASASYCTVQCAKRFSGLTNGNKILLALVVLALGWKIVRMQGAVAVPSALATAMNADLYLLWAYIAPIFSAFLLVIFILSPESQLTALQIRDRRQLHTLWWQQSVSRTSKVLFYTTVLLLALMAVSTVVAQVSDNAWSGYLDADLSIFLPDLLLHLLGLMFYAELLAGNSSARKAVSGAV
jgi:hypothetical protein